MIRPKVNSEIKTASTAGSNKKGAFYTREVGKASCFMFLWGFGGAVVGGLLPRATILNNLLAFLGAREIIIGLIPVITSLSLIAPQIISAFFLEKLAKKKAALAIFRFMAAVPYLVMGLLFLTFLHNKQNTLIWLILGFYGLSTIFFGSSIPLWGSFMGKLFGKNRLGRGFGLMIILFGIGSIIAGFISAWLLKLPYPYRYATLYVATFLVSMLAVATLLTIKESPGEPAPKRESFFHYIKEFIEVLKNGRNLRYFFYINIFASFFLMGFPFYGVYLVKELGIPIHHMGFYTAALFTGNLTAGAVTIPLSDKLGPKWLHGIALITGIFAFAGMLVFKHPLFVALNFLLLGHSLIARFFGTMNMMILSCPHEDKVLYITLGNLSFLPIAVFGPILGGYLIENFSYRVNFGLTGIFMVISFVLLITLVKTPPGFEEEPGVNALVRVMRYFGIARR